MLKKLTAFILVTSLLVACSTQTAQNYSQEIIAKQDSIEKDIVKAEAAIENYLNANEYDSVALTGAGMEEKTGKTLEEVKNLKQPDAKGVDEFRAAALQYFSFLRDVYASYKNVGNAPTEEIRAEEWQKFQVLIDRKDTLISNWQTAKTKFQEDNKLKIKQ